jgi:hypothetical protein
MLLLLLTVLPWSGPEVMRSKDTSNSFNKAYLGSSASTVETVDFLCSQRRRWGKVAGCRLQLR